MFKIGPYFINVYTHKYNYQNTTDYKLKSYLYNIKYDTWYDLIIACTAKWSSIIFSLNAPPIAVVFCTPGNKLDNNTSFFPGGANDGGAWYAAPGWAPALQFLKKVSQDFNKT